MVTKQDIETLIRNMEDLEERTGLTVGVFIRVSLIPTIKDEYGGIEKWNALNQEHEVNYRIIDAYQEVKEKYEKIIRIVENVSGEQPEFLN